MSVNNKMTQKHKKHIDKIRNSTYYRRRSTLIINNSEVSNLNIEIERPSCLTEKERAENRKLMESFAQLQDDACRRIALAYIEGMAAAAMPHSPKATA